MAWNICV